MLQQNPPQSQDQGVRPISFVLDDQVSGNTQWVPLIIRPEELTRNETSRAAVHQTLGRDVIGWADDFGEGLPSVTIAGTTGWRERAGAGLTSPVPGQITGGDGLNQFMRLNDVVYHQYHAGRQRAIDQGRDPALVKLLFVDNLDNFVWSVKPMQFQLRRSKSRPLLFQYNIVLQALDTRADVPKVDLPNFGDPADGLNSLTSAVDTLNGYAADIETMVNDAVRSVNAGFAPIGKTIHDFMDISTQVFSAVNRASSSIINGVNSTANMLIGTAGDLARIGTNIFRTISAVAEIPYDVAQAIGRVSAAYSEVFCIFRNSLRPQDFYEDYTPLFGASNCSSTTGGSPASPFLGVNTFAQLPLKTQPVLFTQTGLDSINALKNYDPVSQQLAVRELARNVDNINTGFGGVSA